LARARNHCSHYPPEANELRRALEALAAQEGEVHVGTRQIDFRGLWADDVGVQLFFRAEGEDIEPLTDFIVDLRELVLVITRLIPRALDTYFRSLPYGTVRPEAG
jgi:hypothetical protein